MKHETFYKATATGILASSVLTGCTAESPQPVETKKAEYTVACNPATLNALSDIALAQSCADEYRSSSIALVNYNLDAVAAENLADNLERDITNVTEGIVSVDVTVVNPTDTARQAFAGTGAEKCVAENVSALGSYAADKTMPELSNYDKIIAESDNQACAEGVYAATDVADGRYIDIFDSLPDEDDPGNKPTMRFTALHESLHLYGLRHAGTLSSQGIDIASYGNMESPDLTTINLNQYINDTEYSEYGDTFSCNVMSNGCVGPNPDDNRRLNAVQQNRLRLPQQLINPEAPKQDRIVGAESVHFDPSFTEGAYATVKINQSLHLPNRIKSDRLNTTQTPLDSIHFIPVIKMDSDSNAAVSDVEVYLSGAAQLDPSRSLGLDTVALGQLSRSATSETSTYQITVNEQLVTVTFDDSGVSINAK